MRSERQPAGSTDLAEQYFNTEDERFIEELRRIRGSAWLASFVDRWKVDAREWSRRQMCRYLALPLNVVGHQVVVKRLFKQAEADRALPLLACFLPAFDRLVRRIRRTRFKYDWQTRSSWQEEELFAPRNQLPYSAVKIYENPRTGKKIELPLSIPQEGALFSYQTRYYLRRRIWRYFRHLGFQQPADYVAAVSKALFLYTDEDVSPAENLLECRGLMHICFRHHDAIRFSPTRVTVEPNRSLAELVPMPAFRELWMQESAADDLMGLVLHADSHLVRVWAVQMIRLHPTAMSSPTYHYARILELLDHADPEVQQFGAELLERKENLREWSLEMWLQLLQVRNPQVLPIVCDCIRKHLSEGKIPPEQCVELACSAAAPIARLGFDYLRSDTSQVPVNVVARLSQMKCETLGREIAGWALNVIASKEYELDQVTSFFDSRTLSVREAAWDWMQQHPQAQHDAALFARILETPYDDLRFRVIAALQSRSALQPKNIDDLVPLWSTVLLGVQRGGRSKLKAVEQLAAAIERQPEKAAQMLPVLVSAARSVRNPEWRAALTALVRLRERHPSLAAFIAQALPELESPKQETLS